MSDSPKKEPEVPRNWTFAGGGPPGPQSAPAGTRWAFRLPVSGDGDTPECHWSSSLLKDGMYGISDDGLTIWVELPRNLRGVRRIHYQVKATPPLDGFVLLKVLPPEAAFPSDPDKGEPTPVVETAPERNKASAGNSKDATEAGCDHPSQVLDRIPGTNSRATPDEPPSTAGPRNPPSEEKEETPASPPLPPGRYFVAVYRNNIPIAQLRRQIEPHRSLAVGKFSRSRNILPDLDLKPHFDSREMARRCSREQAKVFWKDGRILLKNTGKADIEIPGRMDLESEGIHFWEVGEALSLPGGLSVVLEKEA